MIKSRRTRLGCLALAGATALSLLAAGEARGADAFAEEFNGAAGTAPHSSTWNFETGGGGWGNNEQQVYTSSRANSRLDGDGHLLIQARKDTSGWTSARINTFDKFTFTYGTVSARMSMPMGKGLHTGFWLLGTDIYSAGFPESGEVDIAEHITGSNFVHVGIHGPTTTPGTGNGSLGGLGAGSLDLSGLGNVAPTLTGRYQRGFDVKNIDPSQFHTYGVTKTSSAITFLFDGAPVYTIAKSSLAATEKWVFDKPVYVLVNLAVGGDWPGATDGATADAATAVIDWVRYTP
ncbi:glycoside hydrolase family 16 protein [Gordonia caeni]|uniref:Glycoside hydrolase family 16 protein n=1 Tax=Gordonia caeni TaxID=1007097 RepID=A0ABP7PJZ4_9ACTN